MAKKTETPNSLESALVEINRLFGPGSIMRMSDENVADVEVIPTGVLGLDVALGAGGLPKGRIVEIYGPFGGGKSTLALHCVAEAQKLGNRCAYIDVEYGLDPKYAGAIGVDVDSLLIAQPSNGNDAFEVIERLVATGEIGLVIVDSVAALVPRAELEGDYGDANVGLQARMMSQALRKLTGLVGKTNTILLFTNQLREKVGVIYGSPEVTPGGRALPFYASVRIDIRRAETNKTDGIAISNKTKFRIVKNRVGSPYRECFADLEFGKGFSRTGSLLDVAEATGIVIRSGAWYTYEGEQLGQGREKSKAHLEENPSLYDEIDKRVREQIDG